MIEELYLTLRNFAGCIEAGDQLVAPPARLRCAAAGASTAAGMLNFQTWSVAASGKAQGMSNGAAALISGPRRQ